MSAIILLSPFSNSSALLLFIVKSQLLKSSKLHSDATSSIPGKINKNANHALVINTFSKSPTPFMSSYFISLNSNCFNLINVRFSKPFNISFSSHITNNPNLFFVSYNSALVIENFRKCKYPYHKQLCKNIPVLTLWFHRSTLSYQVGIFLYTDHHSIVPGSLNYGLGRINFLMALKF